MKRQRIITAIKNQFSNILKSNGYNTNLGLRVYEWKSLEVENDELDCIIIEDANCKRVSTYDENDNTYLDLELKKLEISIFVVTSGSASSETIRLMRSDIFKAISTDESFGGLAEETICEGDTTQFEFLDKRYAGTRIDLYITYITEKWGE